MSDAALNESSADLSPRREAGLFWQLRGRLFSTILRESLGSARLRMIVLVLLTALFWTALFLLFADGFRFLRSTILQDSLRTQVVHAIFNSFFLTLTVMIGVSSAIVLYGGLYRSEEVRMLLTLPVRTERIVLHKFHETVLISCWGFILLGTPLLIAYGIVNEAPSSYYLLLAPFMLGFVLIPTSAGAIVCLAVSYAMPRIRAMLLGVLLAVGAIGFTVMFWQVVISPPRELLTPGWLHGALARFRFTEQRLLPSWWLSSGLLEAAHPPAGSSLWKGDAGRFLLLLFSHAMMLQLVLTVLAGRVFRASYSRLQGLLPSKKPTRTIWIDRMFLRLATPFSPLSRSLMLKDVRLFRRDPVLWAQFLVFFGLLGLYLISLRKFEYVSSLTQWITVISFMNVAVVALIFSTFATRFILPLISLEGRSFWVLGTAPISRSAVIMGKFLLASSVSIPPCVALIAAGDFMLEIPQRLPILIGIHIVTITILCISLSALAVGNGARFPNLRENSPSRIAAGFGGTLNLVESCILIIGVMLLTGIPGYAWVQRMEGDVFSARGTWNWLGDVRGIVAGVGAAVLLTSVVATLALRMGVKAFRTLQT